VVDNTGNEPAISAQAQTQPADQSRILDLQFAAAIIAKDRKATAEFVSRYADVIYAYARRRLIPRMDLVEDVVQEVFLAALDSLKQFRATSSLRVWLLGIAKHKIDDYYRKRFREPELMDAEETDTAVSDEPTVEEVLDREQLERRVRKILGEIPETYSLALIWRYWDQRSTTEIAAITGKTEKAVERILARARAEFKRKWKHE
jgi:RNA polymerase sigma-70 factor, ECF subfamily